VLRRFGQSFALAAAAATLLTATAGSAVRIIGGTAAQIQASPSTVYVQYQDGPDSFYRCTGSIVDSLHVVTSASCMYSASGTLATPAVLLIDAGLSNLFTPTATDAVQSRSVTTIRIPSSYVQGSSNISDDIAVLTLESPLDLSGPAVKAVALPAARMPLPGGTVVSITAFGRQTVNVPATGPLASMTAKVDAQAVCGDYTGDDLFANHNSTVMCFQSPGSTTCNGDSGAGVLTTGGSPILVGIDISPTSGTCQTGGQNTFVYVAAPEILDFIQGSDTPPLAPRRMSSTKVHLDWNSPLHVGAKLVCSTSGWNVPVHVSYSFSNANSGKVLQATGARASYVVKAKDVGISILCQANVAGGGGTLIVSPLSTGTVVRK
jgi:secreted trypsin-like serine protease